ncbi:hypothetical protein MGAD_03070 [Mycolicibacterium gadium]|uniref:Uncharacterized protein n=1 Tax=Mycolicibacterium gadium TaxID=1794 RepID=A0A7I7WGG9_MYCGU|nr:hypothetical protein MGAD_03070 [Mycolicibacterium gadium]
MRGADFVHLLQSTSPYGATLQDLWRAEVTDASLYFSVCGIDTVGLERYAAISQVLFDDARDVVREAYVEAVAATYGRLWARASPADEERTLIAWMRALVDAGLSFDECAFELRDLERASPVAVSCCLSNRSAWFPQV